MMTIDKLAVKAHDNIPRSDKNNQNKNKTDYRDQYDAEKDNDDRIIDNQVKIPK